MYKRGTSQNQEKQEKIDEIMKGMNLGKPDLEVNKKRFTKAFKDDGEFLTSFQSDCLEPNFYTYESISSIIKLYRDDVAGYAFDALDKLFYLLTKMMELSPEAEYISVMS